MSMACVAPRAHAETFMRQSYPFISESVFAGINKSGLHDCGSVSYGIGNAMTVKEREMGNRTSSPVSKHNSMVPSHHPMPGVDDAPIDAGKTRRPEQRGAHLAEEHRKEKGRHMPDKGFDPDVLSE